MIGSSFFKQYIEQQYFIWMLFKAYTGWSKSLDKNNLPMYTDTKEGYIRYHICANKNWDCANLIDLLNFYDDLLNKLNILHELKTFAIVFHIPRSIDLEDRITTLKILGVDEGEPDD